MGINFKESLRNIDRNVKFLHHGRDNKGMDCVGLILFVYKNAGLNIDHLDTAYSESDANKPHRAPTMIARQLSKEFSNTQMECFESACDGDVLVIGNPINSHVGIVVGPYCFEMTRDKGIRKTELKDVWEFVSAVYRNSNT